MYFLLLTVVDMISGDYFEEAHNVPLFLAFFIHIEQVVIRIGEKEVIVKAKH
jgi:hypothetical protein